MEIKVGNCCKIDVISIYDAIDLEIEKKLEKLHIRNNKVYKIIYDNDGSNKLNDIISNRFLKIISCRKYDIHELCIENVKEIECEMNNLIKFIINNNIYSVAFGENFRYYYYGSTHSSYNIRYYSLKDFFEKLFEIFYQSDFLKIIKLDYDKLRDCAINILIRNNQKEKYEEVMLKYPKAMIFSGGRYLLENYPRIHLLSVKNINILKNIDIFNRYLIKYFFKYYLPPELIILIFEHLCILQINDLAKNYKYTMNDFLKDKKQLEVIKESIKYLSF